MRLLAAVAVLIICCSCSSSDDDDEFEARFRTINASPDAGAIDVYDNDEVLFDGLPYPLSTDYQTLEADSHDLRITLDDSFTTLFDSSKNLREDTDYTLILFGFADEASATLLVDNNEEPESGQARIRFIHAAPTLDNVDVYINNVSERLELVTPTLENVRFARASDYLTSVADLYRIRVTERGTLEVLADSEVIAIDERRVYTIVLLDSRGGGGPFKLSVITDN